MIWRGRRGSLIESRLLFRVVAYALALRRLAGRLTSARVDAGAMNLRLLGGGCGAYGVRPGAAYCASSRFVIPRASISEPLMAVTDSGISTKRS